MKIELKLHYSPTIPIQVHFNPSFAIYPIRFEFLTQFGAKVDVIKEDKYCHLSKILHEEGRTINVVRNKFNVSQCSSSTDDRGRRRHSNEFKTTQAVENKMQWLLFSSLYKDMFWREEQEE